MAQIGLEGSAARVLAGVEIFRGLGRLAIAVLGLGVNGVLDLAQTVGASLLPALVGAPAEVTGAGGDALGVKAGILVEGDDVRGVRGAEDMTAVAAVVTAQEETKGGTAGGRVTARRGRVRLEKGGLLAREFSRKSIARSGRRHVPPRMRPNRTLPHIQIREGT